MGARARFGGIAAPGGTGMEASGNCYISLNSQYQLDQSLEADIPAFYKEWLDAHDVAYTDRHIVEDNPTADELRAWHERSGLPLKRFFNTSGMLYREMKLSKKLPTCPKMSSTPYSPPTACS